jgi:pimeloyl-ACP methyl ester carboxylesterase
MTRIESLLSARLFLVPRLVDDRIYFMSNLSGRLSLYAMNYGGSVPEPLLPPHLALQNPHLIGGYSYYPFPKIGKILVMLDSDGDENYQPMLIPMEGGFPEPSFDGFFENYRVHLSDANKDRNLVYFAAESRSESCTEAYQGNLETGALTKLGESVWGAFPVGANEEHTKGILAEGYTVGDSSLYLWEKGAADRRLLYGKPLEMRAEGEEVPLNGLGGFSVFTTGDKGLVFSTTLHDDARGVGYLDLSSPAEIQAVKVTGIVHQGIGEMVDIEHLEEDRYLVSYNIDGCSWLYEAEFDEPSLTMKLEFVLCGQNELASGVLESNAYDKENDRHILAFSTAVSPTQIYTIEGKKRDQVVRHTNERTLGLPADWLSAGEDASFTSFDGLRVSARLYLPAASLGYQGPRPVVYYVHGGPQGQERPDFAWFSMPLIQYLTMRGFAVFVPNARGSTGYGMDYTKKVDHDWGGDDRLDHVHAMKLLAQDKRLDAARAGVVGRSYGGYMTLTLAGRHPDLWKAAVDMFGPYDLLTFMERIPETWKPYFAIAVGDPVKDRDFLVERSPRTYIEQISAPLMVIQGKNDPRVVERESHDVVEYLRGLGKNVDYLMFEDEGHDVLKFENRIRCYNAITDFFAEHLKP